MFPNAEETNIMSDSKKRNFQQTKYSNLMPNMPMPESLASNKLSLPVVDTRKRRNMSIAANTNVLTK